MASPSSPSAVIAHILNILSSSAHTPYIGEPVSQLEHALQCANLAATASPVADDETVVAALLHDIGQFVPESDLRDAGVLGDADGIKDMITSISSSRAFPSSTASDTSNNAMNGYKVAATTSVGRRSHALLGAQYLSALTFPPKVSALVGSHVAAKRYLCAVDASYHEKLSDASKKSLAFQGGPMSDSERREWESQHGSWTEEMCRLRKWDDEAKMVGMVVPGLQDYRERLENVLVGPR